MAAKRISIAALCDDRPRRLPSASSTDSLRSLGPSSARRPSDSSASDASSSSVPPLLPLLHASSPTRTSSAAYDPIRDADNRHDDPQSARPMPSLSPTTPPPPSAHFRKPPLAPAQYTSGPHFTPIAPRPDPGSAPGSVRNTSSSPPKPPSPPNAPLTRLSQQPTRHLVIQPTTTTRYTPYPPLQPSKQTIAYSTQFSPSSRTDLLSNNGPIAFEHYDPNNAARSSSSRRSSKSKAHRTSPSSSSGGKPGPTSMSANPKKSKSKTAVVGQEEASNTSGGGVLGSITRGEVIPNTAARSTSPSASGSRSGGRPPTPGAASNPNSSSMDDARDVEMELLGALGGDEETRAESASLDARGPPVKLEMYPTTAEDDLLEEVEAMERISAHKPTRQTPLMSSPVKHEPEEGDAMEIDLKRSTLSPSPAILQPSQVPSRTSPRTAPTPIPFSAPHSQPTSASHSLRPTPSPARTPTVVPANLPAPFPPAPPTASTKKGISKSAGGAAKATAATSKSRTAKASAAKKKQNHPNANELLKVSATKSKGGGGGGAGGAGSSSSAPGGSFAFHGTSSGRAAAAAAAALFGAALDADDGYEDQRDGADYRPDAHPPAGPKGQGGAEDESEDEVDLRLYCVCRQLYDDRFMLGCENCDDWFHPNCIRLQEYQCDLLEHFYCEPCQRADSNLKIVWRPRCANGLRHPVPNSSDACWRAAHPPMSKYCSKECGIESMERRLLPYAKQKAGLTLDADERDEGVKRELKGLFVGVRERKKREAVVLRVVTDAGTEVKREPGTTDGTAGASNRDKGLVDPPGMVVLSPGSRLASDLTTLEHDLAETLCELQMRTRELSFILARSQLVKLAVSWSDKPENVQRCCFDSRMLMDGEEWEEWVEGEGRAVLEGVAEDGPGGPPMVPGSLPRQTTNGREARLEQEQQRTTPPEGEESGLEDEMALEDEDSPWCDGRRKCERHAGWQKLQVAECDLNRGIKELIISRLKERTGHLRIRIKYVQAAFESSQQGGKTAEKDSDSVMFDVV